MSKHQNMWIMQENHAKYARPVNKLCRGTCMVIYFKTVDKPIPTFFNEKHKKNMLKNMHNTKNMRKTCWKHAQYKN